MSEFWRRKMRTYFNLWDYDRDGILSRDDFVGLATTFVKFENADEEKAEHLLTRFDKVWEQYVKYAEKKERFTFDELTDSLVKQRFSLELMLRQDGMIRGFFNLMDVNCDGYLQEDEHKRIFDQLGVPDTSWTKETFKAIDVNGDGKLTIEEFVSASFDFFFSEDEKSPFVAYFGPLVD